MFNFPPFFLNFPQLLDYNWSDFLLDSTLAYSHSQKPRGIRRDTFVNSAFVKCEYSQRNAIILRLIGVELSVRKLFLGLVEMKA